MSGKLEYGFYKIIAIGANNGFTGVDPHRPSFLPVRIGGEVFIWEVKPQPEPDFYRLSLRPFPFTGVVDGTVVATVEEQLDVNWLIKYHAELQAYTIAERAIWPTPAWTVADSDAQIKIRLYEIIPGKDQLFVFEPTPPE